MKNRITLLLILFITFSIKAQQHPRLFFSNSEVASLQSKRTLEPYLTMYKETMKTIHMYDTSIDIYNHAYTAQLCAFIYIITDSTKYADIARSHLDSLFYDKIAPWAKSSLKGLTSYRMGISAAMAYDWCYNSPTWPDSFKRKVNVKLLQMADMIATNGGSEQNNNTASNWQGIRGATGAFIYMTIDTVSPTSSTNFNSMVNKVDRYYRDNLGDTWTSSGWNIEGLGYNYYPFGNFIGPYGIALARFCPSCDPRRYTSVRNTYWSIFSSLSKAMATKDYSCIHPDFGDDNATPSGEGVFGQAFWYLPDNLIPEAKYWYDKVLATRDSMKYDNSRAGIIWSYLYYPSTISSSNPSLNKNWEDLYIEKDGNGYYTYRNKYNDSTDMLSQIYLKLRGNKGHSGPDALSFRIYGEGTAWAVGGGRYGNTVNKGTAYENDVYKCSMNTLYPFDPDLKLTTSDSSGKLIGSPLLLADGSGHVISKIARNNVGVANQKRWYINDYDKTSTGALATYIIGDESDNGQFWQLCTYQYNTITSSGNTFTITAENGATMKGTILYPTSNLRIKISQRARGSNFSTSDTNTFIHFQSDNGEYLVVLTVASQGQPQPTISCSGNGVTDNEITVGTKKYTLKTTDVLYNGNIIKKAPLAYLNCDKLSGPAPLTVRFNASKSFDPDGGYIDYYWDISDGYSTTERDSITYTFTNEGSYDVKLDVSDIDGNSSQITTSIKVFNTSTFPNIIPTVGMNYPKNNGHYLEKVPLLLSSWQSDVDGYIKKVEYYNGTTKLDADSIYPFYGYWKKPGPPGTYYITAKAFDNAGAEVTSSQVKIYLDMNIGFEPVMADNSKSSIILYPNPSNGIINIITSEDNATIEVRDITGKSVLIENTSTNKTTLDLTRFNKGIYIAIIKTSNEVTTKSFILE